MIFRSFDLETTAPNPAKCEVVQAAIVEADYSFAITSSRSMLFHAAHIPTGAQRVHGITPAMVADAPPFARAVRAFVDMLIAPDVVSVSFNGCAYDIPIVALYAARFGVTEQQLRARHVDVMRLWWRVRELALPTPLDGYGAWWPGLTADVFAGSLSGAHAFFLGEMFAGAHDATVDCTASLRVLAEMLSEGVVADIEQAIAWSNAPLPGDVDFSGKFRWEGDQVVITFGEHKGSPLEEVDAGFLRWMLKKDFAEDTKQIVRDFLGGVYPQRAYETE